MAVTFQKGSEPVKVVGESATFKPLGMESLLEDYDHLTAQMTGLADTLHKVKLQIAAGMCPYKVGQTVYTNKGLGLNGLVIQEICYPLDFKEDNYWQIRTFAKTKAGEVSSRYVGLDQDESEQITKVI